MLFQAGEANIAVDRAQMELSENNAEEFAIAIRIVSLEKAELHQIDIIFR